MPADRQTALEDVGRALQQYQRSVQAFDDAAGRRLGLGAADMRCLDWLSDRRLTAGELATATGLRPAATTALIDRLEAKGLVRRRPSAADRRRVEIEMTEEGASLVWSVWGPMITEGVRLFDSHTEAQLETFRALLDEMTALTDRHRDRVEAGGG
jgi:DNA-binding MarR family transcriptional regulator